MADFLIVGLLLCSLVALFVHAVMASRDQARAVRAGEPVGSLWQHMMLQHRRRQAERKSKAAKGAKSGRSLSYRPKPLTEAQHKALNLKERKPSGPAPAPKKAVPSALVSTPCGQARDEPLDDDEGLEVEDDFSYLHPDAVDLQVVSFLYENSQGELSRRQVTVEQVGTSHFAGMCHRENAERTFRFDRIQGSVTDEASGKLIVPRKLRDFLRGYGEQELRRQNRARAKNAPEILFTGFKQDRRAALEEQAEAAGMTVRKRVTENLDFLCGGYNAGPSKLADARANGVTVLNEEQFEHLLVTGEVPG